MREFINRYAYSSCLLWLLCVGVLTNINAYFNLQANEMFILVVTLIWIILLTLVEQYRKNPVTYVIIGLVLLIGGIILRSSGFKLTKELQNYQSWYYQALEGSHSLRITYSLTTILVMLILISVLFQILVKRFSLRLLIAVLCLIAGVSASIAGIEVAKIGVISFLIYMMICVVELILRGKQKEQQLQIMKAMPFLMPFFLIVLIILSAVPMRKTPIQWKLIRKCITGISDTIENISAQFDLMLHPEKEEFSLNFTGYSEDGGILGDLEKNDDVAIKLSSNYLIPDNIYLIGAVKNTFDGKKWEITKSAEKMDSGYEDYLLDMAEMYYAISRAGKMQEKHTLFQLNSIRIEFESLHTKTLFYPLKTTDFTLGDGKHRYDTSSANMRFSGVRGNGTSYTVKYMNLNLESKEADEFLEKEGGYRYQDAENEACLQFEEEAKKIDQLKKDFISGNFESLLYHRAQWIRDNYLSVYEKLPQRVRDLAYDITKDYTSDYEKLKALENYLAAYTYTLSPKETPKGEDLLDYMLFTSKEGYCTYYATAFAVMARCIGIPTRYIQGFCTSECDKVSAYEYNIQNYCGHAWVEAYLEGVGWIPFEPTPGYHNQRYQPWTTKSDLGYTPDTEKSKADYIAKQEQEQRQEKEKKDAYQNIIVTLAIILLVILLIVPIYLMLRAKYQKHVYERSSDMEKVFRSISQIVQISAVCYRKIMQGETFCQYGKELCRNIEEMQPQWNIVEKTFLEARYRDQGPNETSVKAIETKKKDMLLFAKRKLTKRDYIRLRWKLLNLEYHPIS